MTSRAADLERLYGLLAELAGRERGPRTLAHASGRGGWPNRGVYFFFETGEVRTSEQGLRVVRVGTHALREGAGTTLWGRLAQHRGQVGGRHPGGGNHRGSIFRLLVGTSLIRRDVPWGGAAAATWGRGSTPPPGAKEAEHDLEQAVSREIGAMPFLWLGIGDPPGPASHRGVIERNAIALLSNFDRSPMDPPSPGWLGHDCDRTSVGTSGLWNQRHVDEPHDPAFLDLMDRYVQIAEEQ